MKKWIALIYLLLSISPLAFAQDKGKDDAKKAAPAAEVKGDKGNDAAKKSAKAKKEPSPAQKARQERRNQCNAQAGEKKGDERKQFMSACEKDLKKRGEGKNKAQQEKLTACNKQAGDKKLKDDDRRKFISECLSAKK